MTLVMVGCLLVGCSQSATDLHDDYLNRLSNVLNTERRDWRPPPPGNAPRASALRLPIPDLRMNPVSYWNVRHCEIFNLISERNSILGRVATPNRIWRYEARVLAALDACQTHPETSESMLEALSDWQEAKLAAWPYATWNGTIGSDPVRDLWRADADGWSPDNLPSLTEMQADLGTLILWATHWPEAEIPDSDSFSAVYQRLERFNHGGQWRRSVQISGSGLQHANETLKTALENDSLCPSHQRTRDAEHAQNVLMQFFIGEIQPYIAGLNRRGEQILSTFSELTDGITVEHPEWLSFMEQVVADHETLQSVSREHAELWQQTLERCQIRIGSPG